MQQDPTGPANPSTGQFPDPDSPQTGGGTATNLDTGKEEPIRTDGGADGEDMYDLAIGSDGGSAGDGGAA